VFARRDSRKMILAVMLVIAVLAVAIPTCEMIGCDMRMVGGMMRITTVPGPVAGAPCTGTWITSSSPAGVVPSEFVSMIIVLIAAMAAALKLFAPRAEFQPVRLVDSNAPPPPLEPRGERYIL
jgi:hypothetical protein